MSKRAHIKEHIHTMEEIGNVLTAMKNLSLIEINKISKYLATQERVVQTTHAMGVDFLSFHPEYLIQMQPRVTKFYIIIGSERGFCGEFNECLLKQIQTDAVSTDEAKFIIIGKKLSVKIPENFPVIKIMDGANTAEELQTVILNLIQFLDESVIRIYEWAMIFNEENDNKIQSKILYPFAEFKQKTSRQFSCPPILYQTNEVFLFNFINQYLFSLLYSIFYQSFIAENNQRACHLESAIERLENQQALLVRHLNLLRQEEITQEIQTIMLSAQAIIEEFARV